jgi:hypothetical protein
MTLQEEYEAARKEGAEAWKHLSPEFRQRHKAEKHDKDGELYWYGTNRAGGPGTGPRSSSPARCLIPQRT